MTAALALTGPAAHAAPQQASMFMDDDLLLFHGDETADRTLRELDELGVEWVRVSVPWAGIAPANTSTRRPSHFKDATDPKAYPPVSFDLHDHLLRVANQLGIKVLFNVTGPAPLWAAGSVNGHKLTGAFKPSAAQFGKFVQMLGSRYDGRHRDENQGNAALPAPDAWSIWNEPNEGAQLQPQWERSKTGKWVATSPRLYRDLVRAALAGLSRSGHGGDTILLGETAPRGLDRYGRTRAMRPIRFLNAFFCLDPKTRRALKGAAASRYGCGDFAKHGAIKVSGYAHHPYSIVSAPNVADRNPLDVTLADAPRLGRTLDAAAALHRIPGGLQYWWTEYGWQTNPPDPTNRGISQSNQALWLAQAEQITRADPRAAALTQFLLRDDQPRNEKGQSRERKWSTYQTGLQLADGTRKPAYDAYRLPLVAQQAAVRAGGSVTLWGFVRPADGAKQPSVTIQFAPEGSSDYATVGSPVTIDAGTRTFTVQVTPEKTGTYRFLWTAPAGPPVPPSGLGGLFGQQPQQPQPATYQSLAVPVRISRR